MNRLKQYLNGEEPPMPEGDYWVVEARWESWPVSGDTARAIERVLTRLWYPRWVVFHDLSGGKRRLRTDMIECVFECTASQRAYRRAFDRERLREEKEDKRPWEDYD
jgi:hypothetical protein